MVGGGGPQHRRRRRVCAALMLAHHPPGHIDDGPRALAEVRRHGQVCNFRDWDAQARIAGVEILAPDDTSG